MTVAWFRTWAQLRRHAATVVGFGVFTGLVAGVVLAGIAGARRTERAFDDMLDDYRVPAAMVYFVDPVDGPFEEVRRRLDARPEVVAHGGVATAVVARESADQPGGWYGELAYAALDDASFHDVQRSLVVAGRRADPSAVDEVMVDEDYAELAGLGVGDRVELGVTPREQIDAAGNGFPVEPRGAPAAFEVVGIVRKPADLAPRPSGTDGTIDEGRQSSLYLTAAFWDRHRHDIATYGAAIMVALQPGADIESLDGLFDDLEVEVAPGLGEGGDEIGAIDLAIRIEARALLLVSVSLGVVALVLIGQAVRRQGVAEGRVLAVLGMARRDLALAGALEWAVTGALAALVAVGVAVAASPLAPIGIARRSALDFGVTVDGPVLLGGGLAVLALLALSGAAMGLLAPRRAPAGPRPATSSRLVRRLGPLGFGPSTMLGVRLALEGGRRNARVSAHSTLLTAALGVGALVSVLTMTASLDRLVDEPRLRGWDWDYDVGNYSDETAAAQGRSALEANDGLVAFSGWQTDVVRLGGTDVPLLLLDGGGGDGGAVGPTVREGRLPVAAGEVALAEGTRRSQGVAVGDVVQGIGPSEEPVALRVVGSTVGISVLDQTAALDEGAIVTFEGAQQMIGPALDIVPFPTGYLVRLHDGSVGTAGLERLRADFPGTVFGPRSTSDIDNLRRVGWVAGLFVVCVGTLAVGTTAHALVSGVRRRRRDLAVLHSLGLFRRQLAGVTAAHSATVAVIGLVAGFSAGIVAGRVLWAYAADRIGVFAGPVVPWPALALGAGAVAVAALALSLWPGISASRTPVAAALRAD